MTKLSVSRSALFVFAAALCGCGARPQPSTSFDEESAGNQVKNACPQGLSEIIKQKLLAFDSYDEAAFQLAQARGHLAKIDAVKGARQEFAQVRRSCEELRLGYATAKLECIYTELNPVQRAIFSIRFPTIHVDQQIQSCKDIEMKFAKDLAI